jgi:Protein of unknown function (DUF2793)
MPAINDPNLGLNYGYSLGEDGWNLGIDQNWKKLGGLMFLSVINRTTTAQPGSPSNGDRYILPAGETWSGGTANQVAVRVAGVWEFYTPDLGWRAYDEALDQFVIFTSTGWKQVAGVRVSSSGSGAFDVVLKNTENLTNHRDLTITVNDINRTINLAGNLVLANNFTTSGNFPITLTATGATNVTLPTTGTLATLNGTETQTNKTLTSPVINTPVINTPDINIASGQVLDFLGNSVSIGSLSALGRLLLPAGVGSTPSADRISNFGVYFVDPTIRATAGNTTETDFSSKTIAANTFGADGDFILFVLGVNYAANGNNKTFRIKFGATAIFTVGPSTFSSLNTNQFFIGYLYRRTSTVLTGMIADLIPNGSNATLVDVGSQNFAIANIFKTTGQNGTASANDIEQFGLIMLKGCV